MNAENQKISARKLSAGLPASFAMSDSSTEKFESITTASNHTSGTSKPTLTVLSSETPNSRSQHDQLLEQKRKLEEFSKEFFRVIEHDHFEFGTTSNVEKLVDKWLSRDLNITGLALQKIFYDNQRNEKILIGILKTISHLNHQLLSTTNRGIAMTALSLPYLEVRECAVRAYEYWEDPELLVDLEMRPLVPAWLEEYKQTVIAEVRG